MRGGSRNFIASLLDSIQELESKLDFFANFAVAKHDFATIKINESAKHNLESVVGVGDTQGGGSDFAIQAPPPCEKEKIESKLDTSRSKPFSMTNTSGLKTLLDSIPTPPKQGWEVEKIGNVLSLEYGKALQENKRIKGDYPVMGSNGIVGYHNEYFVESPAIIVGRKGSAGKITYIEKNCYPIDTTFYVKRKKQYNLKLLYFVLQNLNLEKMQLGIGVPGVNRNDIYTIKIPLPPIEAQEKIVSAIDSVESQIALINSKLEMLEKAKAEILANALNANNERENRQSLKKS